jgi:hypothetical protein
VFTEQLRKAIISFGLSVRMEQLGSHWMDFREISVRVTFTKKSVTKFDFG